MTTHRKVFIRLLAVHFSILAILVPLHESFAKTKKRETNLDSIQKSVNPFIPVSKISEVRWVGLDAIAPRDLESSLPFVPGEVWRDELSNAMTQSILNYYEKRGFYRASVKVHPVTSQDGRTIITVHVEEGQPCILKSIWIDDPPNFKSKHVMLRFKSKMEDAFKLKVGDRYDEQVITDRLRELREWLVSEDFILANTDRIRVTYESNKSEASLVLAVDYGDRVTFGFQNNSIFNHTDLMEFIAQARATGLGKDYIGVIQRKFLEEYKARAYADAKVEAKYSEQPLTKHVTFVFNEGIRSQLSEIKWEGLSDQNEAPAQEAFESNVSRLVQRGYFVEKDIDKAILVAIEDLKSKGYLAAKLIAKSIQPVISRPGQTKVRVVVQLSEGEQTVVGHIDLSGFKFLPDEKVRSILKLVEDKPFNPFALEEGLQKLRAAYLGDGFLDFQYVTKEDQIVTFAENNRVVNVSLRANEGTRIKIGNIRVQGTQKTRPYVVQQELEVKEGEWWLGQNVQNTELNLRKLALFSEIKIIPQASLKGPGIRDMIIDLKEAEPGVIEAGPGFRSDLGVRAFTRLSYNNILGKNWTGSFGAEANRRVNSDYRFIEYQFDTSFVEPRFFGSKFQYSIGLSTRKQRFPPNFNAVTTQGVTGFEYKLTKELTAKLSYKLERIRQFDVFFQNQLSTIDNRSMLIGSLVPTLTFDTRDNPFTASRGWLLTASLEYAQPQFSGQSVSDGGAEAYQKWTGAIHRYTPLTKDIVWSAVAAGGFARSNVAGREIPLIKLFRLGGYSTIRGFQEDSINVDTLRVAGTLTFLNLRTQVDLPLVGDLKIAPFLDMGNLYIDALQANPFFRAGAGIGLHYVTPVGPINLDWGHKLNPIKDEPLDQIHFSVGVI